MIAPDKMDELKKFVEPPSREVEDAILDDIDYKREQLELDLVHIKEWLLEQTNLPTSRLRENDSFLTMFLTGCKGKMDLVKKKLIGYYSFRSRSELFKCRDVLAADYVANKHVVYLSASQKINRENLYRVSSSKLGIRDPRKFNLLNSLRKLLNEIEVRLRIEKISVSNHVIVDLDGLSTGHMLKIRPGLLRDIIRLGQEILPFRFSKICFINAPTYVSAAVNTLILPFLRRKLRERVFVFNKGQLDELYTTTDKSVLPQDFGGEDVSLKEIDDFWNEQELKLREWFLGELSETCTEESTETPNE